MASTATKVVRRVSLRFHRAWQSGPTPRAGGSDPQGGGGRSFGGEDNILSNEGRGMLDRFRPCALEHPSNLPTLPILTRRDRPALDIGTVASYRDNLGKPIKAVKKKDKTQVRGY